jgi:hypothetical protein
MKTVFLKPKPNLLVRDPLSMTPLAELGEEKDLNSYWRRRIKDESVYVPNKEERKDDLETKAKHQQKLLEAQEAIKDEKPKRGRGK